MVVVPLVAVNDCRVVEPTTKRSPWPLMVVVALRPKKAVPAENSVVVALEIFKRAGRERVQVLLVERSWAPAEEVIWFEVPAMVMVVAGATKSVPETAAPSAPPPPERVFKREPAAMLEMAKLVEVPAVPVKSCKVVEERARSCPVVVAPPKMVRPEPVVLLPIVEEASE